MSTLETKPTDHDDIHWVHGPEPTVELRTIPLPGLQQILSPVRRSALRNAINYFLTDRTLP